MKPATTVSAAAAPWLPLASGRALTLGRVIEPGTLDIRRDIAIPLGNTGRFANQLPSGMLYSVAQHCCIGADFLWGQTQDDALAMAFLIHDGHEGPLGDQTSPFLAALQQALDETRAGLGDVSGPRLSIHRLRRQLAEPIDRYLHAEAGLPWPLPPALRDRVHYVDLQLLLAERDHLLGPQPRAWDEKLRPIKPLALKQRIKVMSPAKAAEAWVTRFETWSSRIHAARARVRANPGTIAELTREAAR
jgi:hypothetical protein